LILPDALKGRRYDRSAFIRTQKRKKHHQQQKSTSVVSKLMIDQHVATLA